MEFGNFHVELDEFGVVSICHHMSRFIVVGAVNFIVFAFTFLSVVVLGALGTYGFRVRAVSSCVSSV